MKIGKINFPKAILSALRDGRLVVFAGAGVSMGEPSCLPSFRLLARRIAEGTGIVLSDNEPEDRFLGRLSGSGVDVHTRAARELSRDDLEPSALHCDLVRLYPTAEHVRIVTTNFDVLFERGAKTVFEQPPEVFHAPALPLGRDFNGIVHFHGSVLKPYSMVLTDADFGRAYLTEGWARRFLVDMFRNFKVLFVGYSHEDVIVRYLGRALPESEVGARFALIKDDDDSERWRMLGIEPITYPKPAKSDHGALHDGIRRLADLVQRNILDWRRELTELATRPPPVNDEEIDIIEHALARFDNVRFFTNAAKSPEWIGWLDRRKHLDALFGHGNLNEGQETLAWWLAKHFAVPHADKIFLLIARHGMRLHPRFWDALTREVGLGKQEALDDQILSRWVSIFLQTTPQLSNDHALLWLGRRCAKLGGLTSVLDIFDAMARCTLVLKPEVHWPDRDSPESEPGVDVNIDLNGDHYALNELWEKNLKPSLPQVAERLLTRVVARLEELHFGLRAWQKTDPEWDPINWNRSAIEPHEQDEHPEAVDVLIDVARDCLEWMVVNRIDTATAWTEQLVTSEVPLLRRLAVHTVTVRTDLAHDNKLAWLLRHIDLHETVLHHEAFRAVALAYPGARTDFRSGIVDKVLAYRWPNEDDPDKERRKAHHQFDWLHWIHEAAPDCELATKALEELKSRYPRFAPTEHPDLTHWTGGGWIGPQSPWSVDELLAKSPSDWLPELLSFQGTNFFGPDRDGLVHTIAEAAKEQFEWGIALADALVSSANWNSDLWPGLIRAWSQAELSEDQHCEALNRLSKIELHPYHPRAIADALHSLVKDGGKPYASRFLTQTNGIAKSIWQQLDRSARKDECDNWLQTAINEPAGILVEFWLASISIWRKNQGFPPTLNNGYLATLSGVTQDRSVQGRLGRSILAGQFSFLLAADEEWTRENILPLFYPDGDIAEFQAAWDGFLIYGRLNPKVAEFLYDSLLKAVERLDSDLSNRQDRFVEYYTAFLFYYVDDPTKVWVPSLFRQGSEEIRRLFALYVERQLRNLDETRQLDCWRRWLQAYWENRLQGVPAPLESREIERMLDWLPHLPAVFSDAVALAVRMPSITFEHLSVIYDLGESEIPKRYPNEVAQLLIYLRKSGSPSHIWHRVEKVIDELRQSDLSPALNLGLEELIAKLNLPHS